MRSFLLFVAVSFTAYASSAQPSSSSEPFDLVIRNGMVYDGTGSRAIRLDVGVRGDTIAAIGALDAAAADVEIDAEGLAVAPGFINMLSWAATALMHDGRSISDIKQGVTLEVFGEGHSLGPLTEQMQRDAEASQGDIRFDVTWSTLDEGLRHLVERGVSTNVASFVGATTVREAVLGYDDVDPTPEQLRQMRALVRQAMEEGAVGVGSSLQYVPASFAETEELIALADVVGDYDGLYISHIRNEGDRLVESVEEVIRIAREANARAEIYHLKASGAENWPKMDTVIARIEEARREGIPITADMYTYPASSTGLSIALPDWARAGGHNEMIARLKDPDIRARIREALSMRPANKTLLVNFRNEALRPLIGKTLAEVAAAKGTSPEDALLDLILEDDSRVGVVYFTMTEENLRKQVRLPWVSFGSDGASMAAEGIFIRNSTHPRAYGNFARLLAKYVREEKVIPLEEAVRRLTSLPAENLRLQDRGRIAVGYFADVVVFDPATIQDHATFERPHQYATGVEHVAVNGRLVLHHGRHTGALPGRVVRGPGSSGGGSADATNLESEIRALIGAHDGAEVAVSVLDPHTGARISINGDRPFHAASTMKVAVMIEAYRQANSGRISLEDRLPVENRFRSIVDGSNYSIEDDSDDVIYERLGTEMTVRALIDQMITVSSNLATNILIDHLRPDSVQRTIEEMGVRRMRVLRGVEDIKAFDQGLNNEATSDDLARLMNAVRTGEAVSATASTEMRDVLGRQQFNEMIPAGLPDEVQAAHKTGWITRIHHDAAIVIPPDGPSYVLVILTEGIDDREASSRLGADIARLVHAALRP